VGVLVEADVGLGRVGVRPGEELVQLGQCVAKLPHVKLEGITFYPGHIKDFDETGRRQLRELAATVQGMVADFKRAGLPVNVVSGGSTPALYHSHEVPGLNEIRPGTYIYNDLNTISSEGCTLDDCAASVLVTVVSTAKPGQMIVDGGSKTFSSDRNVVHGEKSFGRVVEAPEVLFNNMNEEHGYVQIAGAKRGFGVGDRLHIIPNHVCVVMNLHEQVYGVRGEQVEQVWKVEARGKLQ
jgi:D-serine deaminase-like pyridoxal phosphate-dependent protein